MAWGANWFTRWRLRPLVLFAAGGGLLLAAWVMGNPLAAAPDEPAHFVKALASASGQWSGRAGRPVLAGVSAAEAFRVRSLRTFRLSPRLALPTRLTCTAFNPNSAACQRGRADLGPDPAHPTSYVGTYPPFVYLPAGLAARLASSGPAALRAGRFADAGVCLLLLLGAARCCRSRAARLGLLLALTPMAVFLFASVTTNGIEIAAALCFAAACLALGTGHGTRQTWVWFSLGGVVLCLSRSLGPVFAAALVLLVPALFGVRPTAQLMRERAARVCAALVLGAAVVDLAWDELVTPHPRVGIGQVHAALRPAVQQLPFLYREAVGRFGWLDTPLPPAKFLLGSLLLAGVIVAAFVAGSRRHRLVLVGACAVVVGLTVAVTAGIVAPTGMNGQGRYTLAVAACLPLLAGRIIATRAWPGPAAVRRALLWLALLGVVLLQVGSWSANARRYAVGLAGPPNYLHAPAWSPPGGWLCWLTAALLGAVLLAASAAVSPAAEPEGLRADGGQQEQRSPEHRAAAA